MIRRLLAVACCLVTVGSTLGCAVAGPEPVQEAPASPVPASAPADGVLLTSLGYRFAPHGFSVPATSTIAEFVDQENTVVAVFTAPTGAEIAAYLRRTLPSQGWSITADGDDSLLFERGEAHGAFTVTGSGAALALRWDERS